LSDRLGKYGLLPLDIRNELWQRTTTYVGRQRYGSGQLPRYFC
jgi:hypothetical protein